MRVANESKAVYEAQRRAAMRAIAPAGPPTGRSGLPGDYDEVRESPIPQDARLGRRELAADGRQSRYSMGDVEMGSRQTSDDPMDHNSNYARQSQVRQAQRQDSATPTLGGGGVISDSRSMFRQNMQGLQSVWQQQQQPEADRMHPMAQQAPPPVPLAPAQQFQGIGTSNPDGEIIWHQGMKYERKLTGPFTGKLVSQGTIISISGEDNDEYRVLTKPTFF
jgi:hypothetical protein